MSLGDPKKRHMGWYVDSDSYIAPIYEPMCAALIFICVQKMSKSMSMRGDKKFKEIRRELNRKQQVQKHEPVVHER